MSESNAIPGRPRWYVVAFYIEFSTLVLFMVAFGPIAFLQVQPLPQPFFNGLRYVLLLMPLALGVFAVALVRRIRRMLLEPAEWRKEIPEFTRGQWIGNLVKAIAMVAGSLVLIGVAAEWPGGLAGNGRWVAAMAGFMLIMASTGAIWAIAEIRSPQTSQPKMHG